MYSLPKPLYIPSIDISFPWHRLKVVKVSFAAYDNPKGGKDIGKTIQNIFGSKDLLLHNHTLAKDRFPSPFFCNFFKVRKKARNVIVAETMKKEGIKPILYCPGHPDSRKDEAYRYGYDPNNLDESTIETILWRDFTISRGGSSRERLEFVKKSNDELRWEDYLLRLSRDKQPEVNRCFFFLLCSHAFPRRRLRVRWPLFLFFGPLFLGFCCPYFFCHFSPFCVVFSPE